MTWPVRLLVFAVAMAFSAINGIETGEGAIDLVAGIAILAAFLWPKPNRYAYTPPPSGSVSAFAAPAATNVAPAQSHFDRAVELCQSIDADIPDEDVDHLCFAALVMGDETYPPMKSMIDGYRSAFEITRFHNLDKDIPFPKSQEQELIDRAVKLGLGVEEAASVIATTQTSYSLGVYLPDSEASRLNAARDASVTRLILDAGSAARDDLERRFNMGVAVGIAARGEELPT